MAVSDIDRLIQILARLPGLGPRSARRAVLFLIKKREALLLPLVQALQDVASSIKPCSSCGNLDGTDPCGICQDERRDASSICVIADVADLWALERTAAYRGRYHVLGGVLSALDGIGPEQLNLGTLYRRVDQFWIDLDPPWIAFGGHGDADHATARLAGDFGLFQRRLHVSHLGLHLLGLFHHLAKVLHG